MTAFAAMSTTGSSSAAASSPAESSTSPKSHHTALPPLTTTTAVVRTSISGPMAQAARNRLSQYSSGSAPTRSRPQSQVVSTFPVYPSALPYALVRDFAYPVSHPLHYGVSPAPSTSASELTTPANELEDGEDQPMPWDSWTSDGLNRGHNIEPMRLGDGPPYSEDEDLQSPVVATRHRRNKSSTSATGGSSVSGSAGESSQSNGILLNAANYESDRGYYVGTSGDGRERYYVGQQAGEANGPGGEFVSYPPEQARHSRAYHIAQQAGDGDDVEGEGEQEEEEDDDAVSVTSSTFLATHQSRYSRDYQFTITSPDEAFHGKAVALFDFRRENENELPLMEGQIIWVSYRHGQGWLVAEDPKTEENGLVPEEYVRLLRDIKGGAIGLSGSLDNVTSPNEAETPAQADPGTGASAPSSSTNGYHQPVVSSFSTSSKDLNPYPTEQLGIQAGQTPPQVVHYHGQRGGSQSNTPTTTHHQDSLALRRDSQDAASGSTAENSNPSDKGKGKGKGKATQMDGNDDDHNNDDDDIDR